MKTHSFYVDTTKQSCVISIKYKAEYIIDVFKAVTEYVYTDVLNHYNLSIQVLYIFA
jgi:hypothetical protein